MLQLREPLSARTDVMIVTLCSYVDSMLALVELDGLRNSLVGVGSGGGADAGLSSEQVRRWPGPALSD